MVNRREAGGHTGVPPAASDLDAFRRLRGEAPAAPSTALATALDGIRASPDPAITFAGLARACAPAFADGCDIELSDGDNGTDGSKPLFRAVFPSPPADSAGPTSAEDQDAEPGHGMHIQFRGQPRAGYPSYAGVLTCWWTSRAPAASDYVTADLLVRHVVVLVDRERLRASAARADDQAAEVALAAITGRTINMAIGIVMRQQAISPENAEEMLRQQSRAAGQNLYEVAAQVVRAVTRSGAAEAETAPGRRTGRTQLRPVRPEA